MTTFKDIRKKLGKLKKQEQLFKDKLKDMTKGTLIHTHYENKLSAVENEIVNLESRLKMAL